jgi:hypothetical protein
MSLMEQLLLTRLIEISGPIEGLGEGEYQLHMWESEGYVELLRANVIGGRANWP